MEQVYAYSVEVGFNSEFIPGVILDEHRRWYEFSEEFKVGYSEHRIKMMTQATMDCHDRGYVEGPILAQWSFIQGLPPSEIPPSLSWGSELPTVELGYLTQLSDQGKARESMQELIEYLLNITPRVSSIVFQEHYAQAGVSADELGDLCGQMTTGWYLYPLKSSKWRYIQNPCNP